MSGRLVICMWVLVMAFASCKTTRETEETPESTVSGNHLAQREREIAAERAAAKEAFDKIVQARKRAAAPFVTDGGWMIWADRQHGNVFEGREVVVARPHQGDRYGREILAKCRRAELKGDTLVLTDWRSVALHGSIAFPRLRSSRRPRHASAVSLTMGCSPRSPTNPRPSYRTVSTGWRRPS